MQVHLKILKSLCRNRGLALFDKVYYLKYKLSIIFRGKIIYAYHNVIARDKANNEAFALENSFL